MTEGAAFPLDPQGMAELMRAEGVPAYRARQVRRWIFRRGVLDFAGMTDLPSGLRDRLAARFSLRTLEVVDRARSADGTEKFLFRLEDAALVEAVLMPTPQRRTLCVSSQAGCAMGCRFCATGALGLRRNLSAREILGQALFVRGLLLSQDPGRDLTNVVMMGMGEPFENFGAVREALVLMLSDEGLGLSRRRVTVSTCGHAEGIRRLAAEGPPVNLAVSLNAADDETRSRLMPINRRYPLRELMRACGDYPVGPYRRITFEYVLLDGVNDGDEAARRLVRLLRPLRAKVNLIPLNPHPGSAFRAPPEARLRAFRRILLDAGLEAPVRRSRGRDVAAACGQLRAGHEARMRR